MKKIDSFVASISCFIYRHKFTKALVNESHCIIIKSTLNLASATRQLAEIRYTFLLTKAEDDSMYLACKNVEESVGQFSKNNKKSYCKPLLAKISKLNL